MAASALEATEAAFFVRWSPGLLELNPSIWFLNGGSVSVATVMNSPDQEIVLRAIEDARRVLGEYIEPGPRDAARTVQRLLVILDKHEVVHALYRIKRCRVTRLVEVDVTK